MGPGRGRLHAIVRDGLCRTAVTKNPAKRSFGLAHHDAVSRNEGRREPPNYYLVKWSDPFSRVNENGKSAGRCSRAMSIDHMGNTNAALTMN